eukprot:scaffold4957_cov152-Amphora_coffeaeformis.AAC.9
MIPRAVFSLAFRLSLSDSMYFYYFLMALSMKPKWLNPMVITAAQISQMIVGVISTAMANYLFFVKLNPNEDSCYMSTENNVAALIMYGSYLLLFLEFFFGRYFMRQKKAVAANGKVANGKKFD